MRRSPRITASVALAALVPIRSPRGSPPTTSCATDHRIDADASFLTNGAVIGIPTGLLIARFHPDPTATGEYRVEWRINRGNAATMFVTVEST